MILLKKLKKFLIYPLTILLLCTPIFAHSGRTDSSGGHRDNKNVSGLGYYHYHHGCPPHLHPDGICPYSSPVVTSGSAAKTVKKQITPKNTTKKTDIVAKINNSTIASYNYKNNTYIKVEDLSGYSFNTNWNGTDRTLKISKGATNAITKTTSSDAAEHEVLTTDIKTYLLNPSTNQYEQITSYNIGGFTIIPLSSLKPFGTINWNETSKTSELILNP